MNEKIIIGKNEYTKCGKIGEGGGGEVFFVQD